MRQFVTVHLEIRGGRGASIADRVDVDGRIVAIGTQAKAAIERCEDVHFINMSDREVIIPYHAIEFVSFDKELRNYLRPVDEFCEGASEDTMREFQFPYDVGADSDDIYTVSRALTALLREMSNDGCLYVKVSDDYIRIDDMAQEDDNTIVLKDGSDNTVASISIDADSETGHGRFDFDYALYVATPEYYYCIVGVQRSDDTLIGEPDFVGTFEKGTNPVFSDAAEIGYSTVHTVIPVDDEKTYNVPSDGVFPAITADTVWANN